MHYFVTFMFDVEDEASCDYEILKREFEDLGLMDAIVNQENDLVPMPKNAWISEYDFKDKEELKNILYTEVLRVFNDNGLKGSIFISVSENATIGIENIQSDKNQS